MVEKCATVGKKKLFWIVKEFEVFLVMSYYSHFELFCILPHFALQILHLLCHSSVPLDLHHFDGDFAVQN